MKINIINYIYTRKKEKNAKYIGKSNASLALITLQRYRRECKLNFNFLTMFTKGFPKFVRCSCAHCQRGLVKVSSFFIFIISKVAVTFFFIKKITNHNFCMKNDCKLARDTRFSKCQEKKKSASTFIYWFCLKTLFFGYPSISIYSSIYLSIPLRPLTEPTTRIGINLLCGSPFRWKLGKTGGFSFCKVEQWWWG